MCKYCESGTNIIEPRDGALGILIGIQDEKDLRVLTENNKQIIIRINYCPMCGRKLKSEIEDDISDDLGAVFKEFMKLDAATRAGIVLEMYPEENMEFDDIMSFLQRVKDDLRLEYLKSKIEEKEGKI